MDGILFFLAFMAALSTICKSVDKRYDVEKILTSSCRIWMFCVAIVTGAILFAILYCYVVQQCISCAY